MTLPTKQVLSREGKTVDTAVPGQEQLPVAVMASNKVLGEACRLLQKWMGELSAGDANRRPYNCTRPRPTNSSLGREPAHSVDPLDAGFATRQRISACAEVLQTLTRENDSEHVCRIVSKDPGDLRTQNVRSDRTYALACVAICSRLRRWPAHAR